MKKNELLLPVSAWEEAVRDRDEIELMEVRLKDLLVTGVEGFITVRGKKRPATWRSDGRCYYKGHRVHTFDIDL